LIATISGGLALRRVLDRSLADDAGSSMAKVASSVYSDALACLVILAFVPVQGAWCRCFMNQRQQQQYCYYCFAVIILMIELPSHADAPVLAAVQPAIRALLKSRLAHKSLII
jgi:hypothetical protein